MEVFGKVKQLCIVWLDSAPIPASWDQGKGLVMGCLLSSMLRSWSEIGIFIDFSGKGICVSDGKVRRDWVGNVSCGILSTSTSLRLQ